MKMQLTRKTVLTVITLLAAQLGVQMANADNKPGANTTSATADSEYRNDKRSESGAPEEGHSHGNLSQGSQKIHQLMEKSSEEMPKMQMSGDVDKDFAKMMADHHRSGIEVAEVEIAHGKNPELKKLAQEMIQAQKKDIRVLEAHQ